MSGNTEHIGLQAIAKSKVVYSDAATHSIATVVGGNLHLYNFTRDREFIMPYNERYSHTDGYRTVVTNGVIRHISYGDTSSFRQYRHKRMESDCYVDFEEMNEPSTGFFDADDANRQVGRVVIDRKLVQEKGLDIDDIVYISERDAQASIVVLFSSGHVMLCTYVGIGEGFKVTVFDIPKELTGAMKPVGVGFLSNPPKGPDIAVTYRGDGGYEKVVPLSGIDGDDYECLISGRKKSDKCEYTTFLPVFDTDSGEKSVKVSFYSMLAVDAPGVKLNGRKVTPSARLVAKNHPLSASAPYDEMSAGKGFKANLLGSTVIRLPDSFSGDVRELLLEGSTFAVVDTNGVLFFALGGDTSVIPDEVKLERVNLPSEVQAVDTVGSLNRLTGLGDFFHLRLRVTLVNGDVCFWTGGDSTSFSTQHKMRVKGGRLNT